jgi:hypothetical protein
MCGFDWQTDQKSQKTEKSPVENPSETNRQSTRQGLIAANFI